MLRLNDVSFDLLTGQASPFTGFGERCDASARFAVLSARAIGRFDEMFGVKAEDVDEIASQLDRIIVEMWNEGWDPDTGNIDLFTTDFGALLANSIAKDFEGTPVFRSVTDLTHMSVWWPVERIEAFPFHKVFKRLCSREGEGLSFYVQALSRLVTRRL